MNAIRVLIVDDEPHARRGLRALLAQQPDITVVDEVGNGDDAVQAIKRHKPDIVLLDVEMPGMNGLNVVEAIGPEKMPAVIFVTAFDQYAVAAFEANAIDYLLKPFSDDRFNAALARARRNLAREGDDQLADRLKHLLRTLSGQQAGMTRFTVRSGDVMTVHRAEDIDWIEADEYYAKLHIGDQVHLIRETMRALEEQLPADKFLRIHRSTIVNLDRVSSLVPMFQGDFTVVLRDGTHLRMSRRRREALSEVLKSFT